MNVIAIDTGREMRDAFRPVLAAARRIASRRRFEICSIGDHRCHLLQVGNAPHRCGLDRSYEAAFHYFARVKAAKVIFCGAGAVRDAISVGDIRRTGGDAVDHLYTRDVLRELKARTVLRMLYFSRGVYDTGAWEWESLLGPRNVAVLEDPRKAASAMLSLIDR